ncbi:MAG: DUF5063 domain-containing protein [Muribaculaceae bacterium]|nr:DUF5063 domain-containing protein [Muribaculaceae bacterium]
MNNDNLSSDSELRREILNLTALASEYCIAMEQARDVTVEEFVKEMLDKLPRIYVGFLNIDINDTEEDYDDYLPDYVDEVFYDSVRRKVEMLLGPADLFLETFEEDMKYSDTPIAASIAESLADIFQPLYNFISVIKESNGEQSVSAVRECREKFDEYWSQTLCNVLRALNHVRLNPQED